jgi:glutathione synthase/RimK-type ligase-like ATP-grasp enzyme
VRVAFCTNIPLKREPSGLRGRNHAIVSHFRSRGHDVELRFGPEELLGSSSVGTVPPFDVGLLCPNDLFEPVPDPDGRFRANACAVLLEELGVPFVNSPLRRQFAANKLLAHALMARARVRQPGIWTLEQADEIEWQREGLVIKPVVGSGGSGVAVVRSAEEARQHSRALAQPCLLQEYVPLARCIRVVATPHEAVGRYEKRVPPGTLVAAVTGGAEEVRLPPRQDLDDLAVAIVRASTMDIAGVDVLEDPSGQLFALEVNANFGFFPRNAEIVEAILACAAAKASSMRHRV